MKKYYLLFFTLVLCFGLVLGDLTSGYAQEGDTEEFTLEEIVVTAQKREENLQKVAASIETISGYELTEMGMTNMEEALSMLPSVIVQRMGGRLNVSIRGMDNDYSPEVFNAMTAMTYDGAYSGVAGMDSAGLYDAQRIEVLAGPQGTLYSRGSTAGVVNVITNNPTQEFESSGSIEYGNFSLLNTAGMVNVPLTDKVAFRAAFTAQTRDGYIDNGTDDNDTKGIRLRIKYDPSENASHLLSTEYIKMGGKGAGEFSAFTQGVPMWEDQPGGMDAWVQDLPSSYFSQNRKIMKIHTDNKWNLDIADLTFLAAVTRVKQDNNYGVIYMSGEEGMTHQLMYQHEVTGELRVNSNADSYVEWLGGAYYYKRRNRNYDYQSDGSTNERWFVDKDWAVFANATIPITEGFRVNLGGRYSGNDNYTHAIFGELTNPFRGQFTGKGTYFNYKVGVEYDLSQNAMLWADKSDGTRVGLKGYDDETVESYQLGLKSRLANERVQLNVTSYYYDYDNFQLRAPRMEYTVISEETGEELTLFDQASGRGGEADYVGVDISSNILITNRDRLDLTVAYLQAEVSAMTFIYEYNPPLDIAGGPLNNAPEWSFTAGYQHEFSLPGGGTLTPRVETRYQDESFVTMNAIIAADENLMVPEGMDAYKVNIQKAYTLTNASVRYNHAGGKWSINGYIKNIENVAVKKNLIRNMAMRIGPPRTMGVVLSVQY